MHFRMLMHMSKYISVKITWLAMLFTLGRKYAALDFFCEQYSNFISYQQTCLKFPPASKKQGKCVQRVSAITLQRIMSFQQIV